ncbi:MAG: glycosyltransferase family 4 protein, partial [Spirulinaceae cyanobacterium]
MNVLHINQSDINGGAAIAGYRLHQGLLETGINSRLLVASPQTKSSNIAPIPRKMRWEARIAPFTESLGFNYLQFVGSFVIPKHKFYKEAEILNFHNLHSGKFSYLALPLLNLNKPAVFTLHDMWSFTGHCAYSYGCDRWKTGCGKCPHLNSYPAVNKDNTNWEWQLKKLVYRLSKLTIVTPSKWLASQAKQSMLNRFPIQHIPNGINTEIYSPLSKEECRFKLDIPQDKKVLMFGAQDLKNPIKGGELLLKALQNLPEALKAETIVLTMGNQGDFSSEEFGLKSFNLGYLTSELEKAIAYSAADVFVLPTRHDNLPLVLQESMACGTPLVSFDVGGVSELVRTGVTGYLANPEDAQDLCRNITTVLENSDLQTNLSGNCRHIAVAEYSLRLQ